uniref:Uncharacterized protein n=1 Tax=viral metagenome TaxID=1070528 RepID=A0A6M3JM72_9ZZZZ
MSPTFGFNKGVDDIEEPILLPEEWYDMEICDEPRLSPNKALFDLVGQDATLEETETALVADPKAGINLVLNMEVDSSDDAFNGRKMKVWLPYPSPIDAERFDHRGQKLYDAKMQRCVELTEAFGGDVSENENGETEITLTKGLRGQCYVIQQRSQSGEELVNSIDTFQGFKGYGD